MTIPHFIDPSPSVKGNLGWFHLRSFDLAGRCTGCRECDRVCPVDVPWVLLNKAAEKESKEKFGYEHGDILSSEGKADWGFRFYVAGSSCCGPSFGIDIVENAVDGDETIEKNGTIFNIK